MLKSIVVISVFLLSTFRVIAQDTVIDTSANVDSLGIMLENYEYPYPVKYMHAVVQSVPVVMAYMDVTPPNYNGKNVLLLHGKNFPAAYWESTIKALTNEGYRVIAPDQVGFGKSSKPTINYTFTLLAKLTRQLLDTLAVEKTAVIGHSTGGMLAVKFALNYPDVVSRLILNDPLGLEDYEKKGTTRIFDDWYTQEKQNDYQSILKVHRNYYTVWKDEYKKWADIQYGMTKSKNAEHLARVNALTYQMIVTQPVLYEFKSIKVPTLIIFGENDHTRIDKGVDRAAAAKMGDYNKLVPIAAKQIPNATYYKVPDSGHLPQFEQKDMYYGKVLDFLR